MKKEELVEITTYFMDKTNGYLNVRSDGNMGEIIKSFLFLKSVESIKPELQSIADAIINLSKSIKKHE
jgi:hypothetical protein